MKRRIGDSDGVSTGERDLIQPKHGLQQSYPLFPSLLIRVTLSQLQGCITLYISFLLVLRGDLLTAVYAIHLFVLGFISPLSFTHTYLNSAIWIVLISSCIRFLIQTPLICQTTPKESGVWELYLLPYCDVKLLPDQFQPLFIYSFYKTDSAYISLFTFIRLFPSSERSSTRIESYMGLHSSSPSVYLQTLLISSVCIESYWLDKWYSF